MAAKKDNANKRAKTTGSAHATKLGKKAGSIADIGLTLQPKEAVYLKCDNLNSMLRIINITNKKVEITPAACVQKALGRKEITGDDLPSHLPVGMGQSDQVRFEVVRLNSDLVPGGARELRPTDLERVSNRHTQFTMEELMDMIHPLPGSESKTNHYLGYRRSIWFSLKHATVQKSVKANIVLDVVKGKSLKAPYNCRGNETAILVPEALGGASVAFVIPKTNTPQKDSNGEEDNESLRAFLKSIGTPGCVSLLQKVIRRRPKSLVHPDTEEEIPASRVVAAVVRKLLDPQQPGIFLPDQGVYVSARQHFLKRLLIIMAEDSEYSDDKACILASSALLLECEPSWDPPFQLQEVWVDMAIELWKSPLASKYDSEKGMQIKLSPPATFIAQQFPCWVLEELGGMRGDKGMLRWLQKHPKNTLTADSSVPTGVDSLDIYCDHHVSGNIVYLWCARTKRGPARIPYGPELQAAFRLVSGVNARRHATESSRRTKAEEKHEHAILTAMKVCSQIIRGITAQFPVTETPVEYEWEVPDGALAGMIGPIELRVGSKTLVVTVDPSDLQRWVVIPRPSRTSNLKDISDAERIAGLKQAAELFQNGVTLKGAPHPSLDGLVAKYESAHKEWVVGGAPWSERKKVTFSIVQYPAWDTNYADLPFECPSEYSQEVIQWVAGKIGGYEPIVQMPTVARDGSGTKEFLTGMESYSLLLRLSLKYPDALWPVGKFTFETRCIPLRLEIRESLLSSLKRNSFSDPYPEWSDNRTLRPLQEEALEAMLRADGTGMGSFLWMLVG